jgi:hypothetical protein
MISRVLSEHCLKFFPPHTLTNMHPCPGKILSKFYKFKDFFRFEQSLTDSGRFCGGDPPRMRWLGTTGARVFNVYITLRGGNDLRSWRQPCSRTLPGDRVRTRRWRGWLERPLRDFVPGECVPAGRILQSDSVTSSRDRITVLKRDF